MAISFVSSGTPTSTIGTLNVSFPTGILPNDLIVLSVAGKYAQAPSTPHRFSILSDNRHYVTGGVGNNNTDIGEATISVFYKIADGTESGTFVFAGGGNDARTANTFLYRKDQGEWDVNGTNIGRFTSGTDWNVTGTTNPGIQSGDYVLVCNGINTDAYTYSNPLLSGDSIACTGESILAEYSTSLNSDPMCVISQHYVTSGYLTGLPVFNMTASSFNNNNPAGGTVILRIRENTTNEIFPVVNVSATSPGTATSVTVPITNGPSGDLLIAYLSNRSSFTSLGVTQSGWNELYDCWSGSTTVTNHAYYKITNGLESGNLALTDTSSNIKIGHLYRFRNSTKKWDIAGAQGYSASGSGYWAVTGKYPVSVKNGDYFSLAHTTTTSGTSFENPILDLSGFLNTGQIIRQSDNSNGANTIRMATSIFPISGGALYTQPIYTCTATATSGNAVALLSFVRIRQTYDTDFPSGWSTYWEATPVNPVVIIDNGVGIVQLSRLDGLGSIALSDGADIRISNERNEEIASDLMPWYSGGTGQLLFKFDKQLYDQKFRIWAGNPSATRPDPTGDNGQYSAYSAIVTAMYASGGSGDRTRTNTPLSTTVGAPTLSTGINDGYCYYFDSNDGFYSASSANTVPQGNCSIISYATHDNTGATRTTAAINQNNGNIRQSLAILTHTNGAIVSYTTAGASPQVATSSIVPSNSGEWLHVSATRLQDIMVSGGNRGTVGSAAISFTPIRYSIGLTRTSTTTSRFHRGHVGMTQFHGINLSTGYRNYDSLMQNQDTFWGTWTQFSNSTGSGESPTSIILTGISQITTSSNGLGSKGVFLNSTSNTYTTSYGNNFKNIYGYGISNVYTYSDGYLSISSSGGGDTNFPSGWVGYEEILIRNFPTTPTTSGQIFRVFTSGFSTEWKNAVTSNGRDIRVTTANGTRLPVDVINTGYFEFNLTGSYPRDTRERIKIWVGNTSADFEPATGEFGQYAVYPSYYYAYYPSGGGLDRTRNQVHLTGINTQTGDSFIPSLPSTFYNGSAYSISNSSYTGSAPLMMSTYFKSSVMTGDQVLMGTFNGDSTGNFNAIALRGNGDVTAFLTHSTNTRLVIQGDNYTSGVWGQAGGRMNAFNDRAVYTDGLEQASSSTNITGSGINRIGIGACLGSSISGHSQAHISWTKFYTGIKSEAEILYDFQNANNFYISSGWRPAFNPNGWAGYDEISITYEASGNLYDQIYLLSTALLSSNLRNNANIDGSDLRIVKTDNITELPLDVINFNRSSTGILAFCWPGIKTSGQRDKIRVWAGNPSASKANVTGAFGQYNVYNTGIIGFYPDGGGQDRSRNQYNMTGFNAGTGDTTGPLSGLKATEYGGVNSLSSVRVAQLIRRPLNIWSIFQTDLTQIQVVAAAGAISNSRYNNAIRLNHLGQVTHHTDVNGGTLEVVALSGYSTATWYGADAYNDNASTRMIYLNGQHRNNGSIGLFFGTNALSIGAFSGTTTPSTGQFFNGRISLTVFDGSTRSGYEPQYNHEMMFNHSSFYGASGWTNFNETGTINVYLEGASNTYTVSLGDFYKTADILGYCYTNTFTSSDLFTVKNLETISSTNTSTYAFINISDGEVTIINLAGLSNTVTTSFGLLDKNSLLDGISNTITIANGQILNDVNISSISNTRTFSHGDNLYTIGLGGISNTQTNLIGVLVKNIQIFGNSDNTTSALCMVTLSVSLDAISSTKTALEGFVTLQNTAEQPDSDFELTVYITIEKGKRLYICRQKDLDLFIARNRDNLNLYITKGLILP